MRVRYTGEILQCHRLAKRQILGFWSFSYSIFSFLTPCVSFPWIQKKNHCGTCLINSSCLHKERFASIQFCFQNTLRLLQCLWLRQTSSLKSQLCCVNMLIKYALYWFSGSSTVKYSREYINCTRYMRYNFGCDRSLLFLAFHKQVLYVKCTKCMSEQELFILIYACMLNARVPS